MGCDRFDLPGGGYAIVCSRGPRPKRPCRWCKDAHEFLCDHVVQDSGRTGKTCDAPMCRVHAKQIGRDRHACPDHFVPRQQTLL